MNLKTIIEKICVLGLCETAFIINREPYNLYNNVHRLVFLYYIELSKNIRKEIL